MALPLDHGRVTGGRPTRFRSCNRGIDTEIWTLSPVMNDREIFINAPADAPPEKLEAYLDAACGGDAGLRARVESLFAADAAAGEAGPVASPGSEASEASPAALLGSEASEASPAALLAMISTGWSFRTLSGSYG